jgi:hypothetical protein
LANRLVDIPVAKTAKNTDGQRGAEFLIYVSCGPAFRPSRVDAKPPTMNRFTAPKPFLDAARSAFPSNCWASATTAARQLAPVVDDTYRTRAVCLDVDGQSVYIPQRVHFRCGEEIFEDLSGLSLWAERLLTRSTDGHLRQRALRNIVHSKEIWVIPFVVLLTGDYVV